MSLIEVVVFIVVLAIGIAATLAIFNRVTSASVDPIVRKQALVIASSLLEEIEQRGFTFCDPDDANVYTAISITDCTTQETIGPEPGETRYADPRYDNVNDYNNFEMGSGTTSPGIKEVDSNGTTSITGLDDFAVRVTVATISNGELPGIADTTDALRITVTAAHVPTGTTVSLQGYRLRYAPNSP